MSETGRYNSSVCIPRNYRWTEHGSVISGSIISEILKKIRPLRTKHGGDLAPGWEARVGNQICDDLPGFSACAAVAPPIRSIGLHDVGMFLNTVKNWVQSGGVPVEDELAEKRASICATCPMNVKVRGCHMCKKIIPQFFPAVKDKITSFHNDLDGCGVCGCDLKTKIWMPPGVLSPATKDLSAYPDHCWIPKELCPPVIPNEPEA